MTLALALRAGPWIAILLLLGALAYQTDRIGGLTQKVENCERGRALDRQEYEQGQRDAAAQNKAEVSRIRSEQEKISAKSSSDYARDLARLRAEFLRKQNPAAPGSAQGTGAGTVPDTSSGTDGPATVQVPANDILYGAETELRLMHLQNWVREQLGVRR